MLTCFLKAVTDKLTVNYNVIDSRYMLFLPVNLLLKLHFILSIYFLWHFNSFNEVFVSLDTLLGERVMPFMKCHGNIILGAKCLFTCNVLKFWTPNIC